MMTQRRVWSFIRSTTLALVAALYTSACGSMSADLQELPTQNVPANKARVSGDYEIPNFALKKLQDDRPPIPIFIITCDRLTWLKRALTSLDQAIARPIEIIIHDNSSTFPPMVDFLEDLAANGIQVVHNPPLTDDTQLNRISNTIAAWYRHHDAPYYAVTDPDVELNVYDGSTLDFYIALLERHPDINVVGPLLRFDDLPDHYPFKPAIIANETKRDQEVPPVLEHFNGQNYKVTYGGIDTTFGLYRKSFHFKRINPGIQAYQPYAARHLDWYLDPNHLTPDQAYYMRNASKVSHSGGTWLREVVDGERPPT